MKSATSIVALIFITVSLFGFALMCENVDGMEEYMNHSSMNDTCMMSKVANCTSDGLPMVLQHIAAYQSFSNTLVSSFFFTLTLLLIGLFVLLSLAVKLLFVAKVKNSYTNDRWKKLSLVASLSKIKLTSWISLFENSPSFV